jgi:hypothetical protein
MRNMNNNKITVKIFAPPLGECAGNNTWQSAASVIGKKLQKRYGENVETEFIELFSPESFNYPDIMELVQTGDKQPPFITVNDRLVHSGGKISERAIREWIDSIIEKI